MRATIKRWAVLGAGWAFIVLGVAGLFLPVLQGILFLLIGLIILSSEYVWAHHLLEKIRRHFPRVSQRCHAAEEKAHEWLHRIHSRGRKSSAPPIAQGGLGVAGPSVETGKPGDSPGEASTARAGSR